MKYKNPLLSPLSKNIELRKIREEILRSIEALSGNLRKDLWVVNGHARLLKNYNYL